MPRSRDYLLSIMGVDIPVLSFIAKNLAVSFSDISRQFGMEPGKMRDKIAPLLAANYVREQSTSGDPVYSITADGIQELGRTSHRAFAAHV